jgi:hypothetical protein
MALVEVERVGQPLLGKPPEVVEGAEDRVDAR